MNYIKREKNVNKKIKKVLIMMSMISVFITQVYAKSETKWSLEKIT